MTRRKLVRDISLLPAALMPTMRARAQSGKGGWIAYIGTYTSNKSKGIYAFRFQPASGEVTEIGLVAVAPSPSFLVVHPNQRFLYAANELDSFQGQKTGAVSAFSIDPATGRLKLLNQQSSKGSGPCHVAMDKAGKWLIVANYNSGSIAMYPVKADGSLGEASSFFQHKGTDFTPRQDGPHAHWAGVSADSRFVLICDLGLDQVLVYRLDATKGTLTPHQPPFAKVAKGLGPRHAAFRPDGKFLYDLNEIVPGVTVFRYDAAKGTLEEIQTISSLPADYTDRNKSGAEIAVHPTGKFVYSSNRGHNSIAIFTVDAKTGKLTAGDRVPTQGKTPRSFAIDPTGTYLFAANQDSDNIVLFKIDQTTGGLTPTGKVLNAPVPVCVVFAKESK